MLEGVDGSTAEACCLHFRLKQRPYGLQRENKCDLVRTLTIYDLDHKEQCFNVLISILLYLQSCLPEEQEVQVLECWTS
jgi:hypothetical protein